MTGLFQLFIIIIAGIFAGIADAILKKTATTGSFSLLSLFYLFLSINGVWE